MISDAVCIAAIETVLKPLGSASIKHYMPGPKADAIAAMRGVLTAQAERDAALLDEVVDGMLALEPPKSAVAAAVQATQVQALRLCASAIREGRG